MEKKKLYKIFDLDGTCRDISHRLHYIQNGKNKWDEFFDSCDKDEPVWDVLNVFIQSINVGNRTEIWSGACESSFEKTRDWLNKHVQDKIDWENLPYESNCVGQFIANMRPIKDYTKDFLLKERWLQKELEIGNRPDMFYDDRMSVVAHYRSLGVTVAQVSPYFDIPVEVSSNKFTIPRKPTLTVMIGPSGSGKDYWLQFNSPTPNIVSSDNLRYMQFPSDEKFCDDAAYTNNGFKATFSTAHNVIKAYLEGGADVVYNATNLRAKNRKEMLKHVGADTGKYNVDYIIVDRSLDDKLKSFNLIESDGHTSEKIIRKHHQTFQSSKKHALKGDGFDFINVKVVDNFYEATMNGIAE